ncbi:MAG: molecular chaperone HtpG [Myxococcota bacterium]
MNDEAANQFQFEAEVQRVLSLVINSLYTNTEVFLRELISNASDALDKARYLRLTEKDDVVEAEAEAAISITVDADTKTLTIEDNGVGMSRDEVIANLGTIARSGTNEFATQFAEATKAKKKDEALDLIGQFGVGFYSVFMVASRVDVETLSVRQGAEAVLWRSSGDSYTVLPGEKTTPGTRITLHLREEAADEFTADWRIEGIVKKYSDFVMFPIRLGDKQLNKSSALWRMPRSKVSDEEHQEFFKHLTNGLLGDAPLATVHYSVDAPVQFSALVYVPERRPGDLFQMQEKRQGLRLYARRVLIQENCESVLPVYLRFLRGVVDSEDLQLNVSRETLQENRTVRTIEAQLSKQVLKQLAKLADENAERYEEFYKNFGQVLKEGVSVDYKNKDAIADLMRFETLLGGEGKLTSLKDYVDGKKDDQDGIYYITGTSREHVERSPHLEVFRKKGIDVLFMVDPIDEWVVKTLPKYGDLEFKSVVHGELKFDDDNDQPDESEKDKLEAAVKAVKAALGDKVTDVRLSSRLTETASCLVSREGDPGANMERLMKMMDDRAFQSKRMLELNPGHPVVKNLAAVVAKDPTSAHVGRWSALLYDQALLSEGVIEDPAALVRRIQDLLVQTSNAAVSE